jgi:hypothetical protein
MVSALDSLKFNSEGFGVRMARLPFRIVAGNHTDFDNYPVNGASFLPRISLALLAYPGGEVWSPSDDSRILFVGRDALEVCGKRSRSLRVTRSGRSAMVLAPAPMRSRCDVKPFLSSGGDIV